MKSSENWSRPFLSIGLGRQTTTTTMSVASYFYLGDVWNGVSTLFANCSIRDLRVAGSLTLELEGRCTVLASECMEKDHGFARCL